MINRTQHIIIAVFIALLFFAAGWALHPCPDPVSKVEVKITPRPALVKSSVGASYESTTEALSGKKRMSVRQVKRVGIPIIAVMNDSIALADSANISDSTNITVRAFVAKSDTVTFEDGSKVQVDYTFPSDAPFRFYYKPHPDTTREITLVVHAPVPFVEKPVVVSTATAAVLMAVYLLFGRH